MAEFSCRWMHECLLCVIDELRRHHLLQSWIEPEAVWEGILSPCKSCTTKNPNPRKCTGWTVAFRGHQALVLVPSNPRGSELQATIEGQFSTRSSEQRKTTWHTHPFSKCSAAVLLRDTATNAVLTRQHLDLANPTQPGPTWHVQLGGVGSGLDRSLELLRWPSPPTDLILLVELSLFLLHNSAWHTIKDGSTWSQFVRESEELSITHYRDAFEQYWSKRHASGSWLAAQCNQSGSLGARPR